MIIIKYCLLQDFVIFNDSLEVLMMKRYLSLIFVGLGIIILVVGLTINVYWSGMVAWGLTFVCFMFAAYFTKYIPNEKR